MIPSGAGVSANQGTCEREVAHHLFLQTHLQFQIQSWKPLWDQMDINLYNEESKHKNYLDFLSASILKKTPKQTAKNKQNKTNL